MRCTYFQQNSTDTLKKFIEGSIDCVSLMNKQQTVMVVIDVEPSLGVGTVQKLAFCNNKPTSAWCQHTKAGSILIMNCSGSLKSVSGHHVLHVCVCVTYCLGNMKCKITNHIIYRSQKFKSQDVTEIVERLQLLLQNILHYSEMCLYAVEYLFECILQTVESSLLWTAFLVTDRLSFSICARMYFLSV